MAQHDKIIGPGTGAEARMDINAAFAAMASSSAGPSEPPNAVPGQLWFNSTTDRLYIRNKANTAWVIFTSGFDPTDVLTKAAADARYMPIANVYDRTASDARFVAKGTPYTRTEINARFNPLIDPVFTQSGDTTKRVHFDNSLITAGQDRAIRAPLTNGALGGWELIANDTFTGNLRTYLDLAPFTAIQIEMQSWWPTTAGNQVFHVSSDNGATWLTSAIYNETYMWQNANAANSANSPNEIGFYPARNADILVGNTAPGSFFSTKMRGFNKPRWTRSRNRMVYYNSGSQWVTLVSTHQIKSATAFNALRLSGSQTFNCHLIMHGLRG